MKSAGPTTSPTVIHKPVALQEVDTLTLQLQQCPKGLLGDFGRSPAKHINLERNTQNVYHPHSNSVSKVVLVYLVSVGVCLFVNVKTLEPFEKSS